MAKAEKTPKKSTDLTLSELADMAKFDKSLQVGEYPRYLVSKFRSPGRTADECVALVEEYAAKIIAQRDTDDPSPDDPVVHQRIAEKVEAAALKAADDKQKGSKAEDADEVHGRESAQAKAGRDHRERKMLERPTRRIAQHLATYPEPPKGAA